ncbi:YfcZ/YiiS family protein [Shewanella sp. D64]|uniref:DUF406 family protein n=1 Tax=unclassified Shewanella TaxID=196818 RepID=UPI0022BA6526|nr:MULTISPECIES: DUF406 family protein [unclassified Shewanella]MEC4725251.1 YfcZ/YiiS family protein [Shewanella sp. D64]MEC4735903.1 YfcZ/YiiS family protein [Shewanella sp. E94]WBJ93129.1 YfcZ/YiiS family protein [Shewanella sp. MTB7]
MKNIKESQSALVNDTCTDCGSYADIGAVIDEHDTLLTVSFTGSEAQAEAEVISVKAKARFDGVESVIKVENEIVTLNISFAYSAEKMIFQLENGI